MTDANLPLRIVRVAVLAADHLAGEIVCIVAPAVGGDAGEGPPIQMVVISTHPLLLLLLARAGRAAP